MPKNFRELRDDLAERVGEKRMARARREADEEVQRYERTVGTDQDGSSADFADVFAWLKKQIGR